MTIHHADRLTPSQEVSPGTILDDTVRGHLTIESSSHLCCEFVIVISHSCLIQMGYALDKL